MNNLECEKCKFRFTQKSSLLRHTKRCVEEQRAQGTRHKSCRECATSKTRCDMKRPQCTRCTVRKTQCSYTTVTDSLPREESPEVFDSVDHSTGGNTDAAMHTSTVLQTPKANFSEPKSTDLSDIFDCSGSTVGIFDHLATNSGRELSTIADLGLLQSIPSQATTPTRTKHSMELMFRILRTWPRKMAKDIELPPIIHPSQVSDGIMATLLSNCFTLAKMWHGQCSGASEIVQSTVRKEMNGILTSYKTMNETTLLAALQSMVVYTLIMLFPSNEQTSLPLLSDDMFLQIRQVIYHCATSGLILEQESNNARPPWEAWVHITTKRRAVLSLYIIHWSYSVYHCLPSFDCKDLGFIPAPSPGYLWQASDVKMWESLYNRWLAQWDGNIFLQWEFFGIGPGVRMGARAEEWLEDADEFGMLFISMANAWEREAEFEIIHL